MFDINFALEWKKFLRYFKRLNYEHFIEIGLILLAGYLASKIIKFFLNRYLNRIENHDNKTRFGFLRNTIDLILGSITLFVVISKIPALRSFAVGLFAGASIFAALIGFASQKAFADIVSGIFIVIFKPFRVGDTIQVAGNFGTVEDITLRHTVIRGLENKRIVIPNSSISAETIVNSTITDPRICKYIEFPITYQSDIDTAMRIIQEEALSHKDCIDNRTQAEIDSGLPQVAVRLVNFNNAALNLRAYVWSRDIDTAFDMACDLNKSIKEAFDREGIELAYPHYAIITQEKKKQVVQPGIN